VICSAPAGCPAAACVDASTASGAAGVGASDSVHPTMTIIMAMASSDFFIINIFPSFINKFVRHTVI
jgi:hypothetical protein